MPKPQFQTLTVAPKAAVEVLVMPQFGDIIDENGEVIIPSSEEGDWTVFPNVPFQIPIIDIFGNQNVMKRRDATCKIIYSSLGQMSNRFGYTEKVYIAAENCQAELYQGAFRDWESHSEVFQEKALELIGKAAGTDIFTNKWFGYVGRPQNATYSLNKFNGIWHWVAVDVNAGTIPSSQTVDFGAAGSITNQNAYDALMAVINAQSDIMSNMDDDLKTMHVTKNLAKKAWRYLVSIGQATPVDKAQGMPKGGFEIEGIRIKPKNMWGPVLQSIMGAAAEVALLVLDGNFVYLTDEAYGGGPNSDGPALEVFYDERDMVTRWRWFNKSGTMLAVPGYAAVGTTSGVIAQL